MPGFWKRMGHDCRRVHRSFLLGENGCCRLSSDLRLETDERLAAFLKENPAFQIALERNEPYPFLDAETQTRVRLPRLSDVDTGISTSIRRFITSMGSTWMASISAGCCVRRVISPFIDLPRIWVLDLMNNSKGGAWKTPILRCSWWGMGIEWCTRLSR